MFQIHKYNLWRIGQIMNEKRAASTEFGKSVAYKRNQPTSSIYQTCVLTLFRSWQNM